jgi:hypothetical protein
MHDDDCTCGLNLDQHLKPMLDGLLRVQLTREAIASVSLSHRPDCVCIVCRAAGDDEDALIELSAYLFPPGA